MYFVFPEFIETDKFQYLKIQKNASSTVTNLIMETMDFTCVNQKNLNKVRWAVIRDPYERFISGLAYDLKRHDLKLEDIKISDSFVSNYMHPRDGNRGNINHSVSQVQYLINADIDYYVDIKDLNIFLKMHFNKTYTINENNNINLNVDKNEIMKYLTLDYKIYNNIISSSFLWKWQQGKIF